jgi:hypothetical protein
MRKVARPLVIPHICTQTPRGCYVLPTQRHQCTRESYLGAPLPYCGIVEPIRDTAQFEAAADTATVKAAVRLVLVEKHHGRLDKGDDEFPAIHFGSATSLRLWGLGGPRTYGRLPIIVRISVASRDGHSSVNVDLSSEEGFYLARLPGTEEHYRPRFSDLVDDLRSELPAHS